MTLKIGDEVFVESWDETIRLEQVTPLGAYLVLRGRCPASGQVVHQIFNPKTGTMTKRGDDGTKIPAEVPDPHQLMETNVLDIETIEPGIIVESRDRLWRVDSVDDDEGIVKVSSISGVDAKHDLYARVEELRAASHPPPDVTIVGNPGYQRLLLQALQLDLIHGTAALIGLQRSRVQLIDEANTEVKLLREEGSVRAADELAAYLRKKGLVAGDDDEA